MDMDLLINKLSKKQPVKLVVAEAQDEMVLKAVYNAYKIGIVIPILCGDEKLIKEKASHCGVNINKFEIIHTTNPKDSVKAAISLILNNKADILMKGLLQTSELLKGVLDKNEGLRGEGILSHVGIINSKKLGRTVILTDSAMVMYPDVKTKVHLINNAVIVAKSLGIEKPKVAPIAAVEVVNMDMQATVDAAVLTAMNNRGQIKDCIVDGPLALDLALSPLAVQHKNITSDVAGYADILLFHNIESANATYKAMSIVDESVMGGIVMGAKVPIVLTSRSDSDVSKLYSIACAVSIKVGELYDI